ncbi:hypothetical protein A3H26_03385 [candidate division WWE3 bacterium RIFCSPLOWO2_12_FULL_36_10]|uniref:SpoVT-AbrB domain-containing protein n=1 Tax=candidate division WWE3 bacterium RIFCSPLOWO2_12_FULL_36_10 TaxID=1802630 RepID=A0A1F4VIH4_UNCKA|nr:MAG: hypothetical protein A3H26_03385 [candidate division WWE3 bacterium RIFCSPLOWO2_12_FULL_36_10]
MDYATLTSQNQITIPKLIRRNLKLKPGDKVKFYTTKNDYNVVLERAGKLKDSLGLFAGYKTEVNKVPEEGVWIERNG